MPPLHSAGTGPEAEGPGHTGAGFPDSAASLEYAGRYRLEARLGNGGMGVVHLATSASGLRLAVKVVHAEHAADPEFRARFRQEVLAARRVSGAFTAPVVDADPDAVRPWMATLFIDGPTLSERVKRNGPLAPDELRRVGSGLAEALRDIHRAGVVHRDLKPGNVLLAPDGPKVIDFGISRPSDSDLRTETGKLIGTPPFMAPEQFQRPREVGPAADVFAMGAVLVHAATGRGPFDSDSPYIVAYQVVHDEPELAGVPHELLPLVSRCLAKEPADRPTAEEVMIALRAPIGETPTVGQGFAVRELPDESRPDQPVAVAGGASGAVGGAGGGSDETGGTGGLWVPGGSGTGSGGPGIDPGAEPAVARVNLAPVRTRRGRRARAGWAAGCTALAVAVVAGAVVGVRGLAGADGGDQGDAGREPAAVAREFQPWATKLGTTGANRMPVCANAGEALYCTAPGVGAARLRAADGAVAWKQPPTGDPAAAGLVPVVSGGLVHVRVPGKSAGRARLEARDPDSGAVRWSADVSAYPRAVYAGDAVLLVGTDGTVRRLDAATGRQRWAERLAGPEAQWVTGPGGRVVYTATASADAGSTTVRAIDPASGTVTWQVRLRGGLDPVQATDGALLLLSVDLEQYTDAVVRLDLRSRTERRLRLPLRMDQGQATLAEADGDRTRPDAVYLTGADGALVAVDMGGAPRQRWRLQLGATRMSRPVAADGRVLLSAQDGRLLAVDAGRGVLLGDTEPRMGDRPDTYPPLLPAPLTGNGRVYATAPDGSVFAVSARDPGRW
ncbi:serine/threonine-protein kinase [Streptomyces sp. LP05-1]|uniref:Serine/threonine-protein kinase n=1 Tax=Streptomyces pyxinae TaxID=2970734 RepID=A0ABT2CQF0_9ACTN|nr:serine/threonine-protein kinase [Streptomyces sp. LP05-1]MCS0639668.1 serine/threonine-protein kinase [Streptomyces sp. LP05-1]